MLIKYHKKIVILAVVILACIVAYFFLGYMPYRPVIINQNQELQYNNSIISDEHLNDICKIFDLYGEHYIKLENTVLIRPFILMNKDLLQNYTYKAKTKFYLKNQKTNIISK